MEIGEGNGWRLVIDPDRRFHQALIGGEHWAVELHHHELEGLREAVSTLTAQLGQLSASLMEEEQITLELDLELESPEQALAPAGGRRPSGGTLHVALEGDRRRWALRFVLTPTAGARGVEGGWSPEASLPLATALMRLQPGGLQPGEQSGSV